MNTQVTSSQIITALGYTPENVKVTDLGVNYNDLIDKIDMIEERTHLIHQLVFANIQQKILILIQIQLLVFQK